MLPELSGRRGVADTKLLGDADAGAVAGVGAADEFGFEPLLGLLQRFSFEDGGRRRRLQLGGELPAAGRLAAGAERRVNRAVANPR